jgi:hypothetical protein
MKQVARWEGHLWVPPNAHNEDEIVSDYVRSRNMTSLVNWVRYGFAYRFFRPEMWWYECVEITRRLSVSSVIFYFKPGDPVQLMGLLIVCEVYLIMCVFLKPYRTMLNNLVAIFCHVHICLTLLCGFLLNMEVPIVGSTYDMENEKLAITIYIVVSQCCVILFGVYAFGKQFIQQQWQSHLAKKAADEMTAEFRRKASGDDGDGDDDDEKDVIYETIQPCIPGLTFEYLQRQHEQQMVRVLKDLDVNHSGLVEIDELGGIASKMFSPLSTLEAKEIFRRLDPHGRWVGGGWVILGMNR